MSALVIVIVALAATAGGIALGHWSVTPKGNRHDH